MFGIFLTSPHLAQSETFSPPCPALLLPNIPSFDSNPANPPSPPIHQPLSVQSEVSFPSGKLKQFKK